MRLICPECNALYDIPGEMIPPEGREVECSTCGRVWLQGPEPAEDPAPESMPAPAPAVPLAQNHTMRGLSGDLRAAALAASEPPPDLGEAPALQRELPDDVLSILREETARELGARRAARGEAAPPPRATTAQPDAAPPVDPEPVAEASGAEGLDASLPQAVDWPATTVTVAEARPASAPMVELVPSAPRPVPEPAVAPRPDPEIPPIPGRRVARSLPDVEKLAASLQTDEPQQATAPAIVAHAAANGGYRAGLTRALAVAAGFLIAYLLASAWVGTGNAPGPVAALVAGVDAARMGLQDAAAALLGRGGE